MKEPKEPAVLEDVAAAIEIGDVERLLGVVGRKDWSAVDSVEANRLLQLAGLYGASGRTMRFERVVCAMLDGGCEPTLASCALLQLNTQGERILKANPATALETDADGATPLHHAAERGNLALATALCDAGAPLDAKDSRGETPLAKALHAGPWKAARADAVVDLLRRRGATVDLHAVAALGDAAELSRALSTGATIDERDQHGRTALFCAARNNELACVRLLLGAGADADAACADGQTPLSTACLHALSQECDVEVVRALVAHGAALTLQAAIVLEDLDALRGFVQREPAVLQEQGHDSALGYAIHAWRPGALRCLMECGSRPNAENWAHIQRIAADSGIVRELRSTSQPP